MFTERREYEKDNQEVGTEVNKCITKINWVERCVNYFQTVT